MSLIWLPMWKCSIRKSSSSSASLSLSVVSRSSGIDSPNLARSPTELPQRPVLLVDSRARMPIIGAAPRSWLA